MNVYRLLHKPTNRFYKGTTSYGYTSAYRMTTEEFIKRVFTDNGKTYTKKAWALSAKKQMIRHHDKHVNESDLVVVEYLVTEVGRYE